MLTRPGGVSYGDAECADRPIHWQGTIRAGSSVSSDTEGPYLLLCDGKRRKLENPKRKKRGHVAVRPRDFRHPVLDQLRTGEKRFQPRHSGGRWPLSELN